MMSRQLQSRRKPLELYLGKDVEASGVYERCNVLAPPDNYRQNKTVLLQDVTVFVQDKELFVGHMWVQHANSLVNLKAVTGQRVWFRARVSSYQKRLSVPDQDGVMVQWDYSLTNPFDAELLDETDCWSQPNEPVPNSQTSAVAITQQPDILTLLPEIKALAVKVGPGILQGTLPHIPELVSLSNRAGGPDQLRKALAIFVEPPTSPTT